jgi:glycosyltransferase involved in cell wall biosynthesis
LKETEFRPILEAVGMPVPESGMLLHVGGGQWYKNLEGVIELYAQYAAQVPVPLPLWCISPPPNESVRSAILRVPDAGKVVFFSNLDSHTLQAVYSTACAFLFPSLAEGFGWPIIEALACGCPVLTTDAPPMNEVGGDAADYLPLLQGNDDMHTWAANGARQLMTILARGPEERARRAARGVAWSAGFSVGKAIDGYLAVYRSVLDRGANA